MSEKITASPEQMGVGAPLEAVQPFAGKVSVFEALASDIAQTAPNKSNYSSQQGNADYDDQ